MSSARTARMTRELQILEREPPPGVSCWPADGSKLDHLEAEIKGVEETPYEGGRFKVDVLIPERYPFQPPQVRFVTPIYHPNIDDGGRICLDLLKMPPKGSWKPSLNVSTVLCSIQQLMNEPNPDDGLMSDISKEFAENRALFTQKARELTQRHATGSTQATNDQKAGGRKRERDGEGDSEEEEDDAEEEDEEDEEDEAVGANVQSRRKMGRIQ